MKTQTFSCSFKSGVSSNLPTIKPASRDDALFKTLSLRNADDYMFSDAIKHITPTTHKEEIIEDIPDKIEATYKDDYNIVYVDGIIRKKLQQEKYSYLEGLKSKYLRYEAMTKEAQNYVMREKTLNNMKKIKEEMNKIENGEKLREYDEQVKDIISSYKKYNGLIKTISFGLDDDDKTCDLDEQTNKKFKERIVLIEKYLAIAVNYININIIKINVTQKDVCSGCGISLSNLLTEDDDFIRCPDSNCQTENIIIVKNKIVKDIVHNTGSNAESIENFLRAFTYYQGLQNIKLPDDLFIKLDDYFKKLKRPSGNEIKKYPLNSRGRRFDTDHKMIWSALSIIGYSDLYKHSNYICSLYWGWKLPNVMHLKETIIYHYNITQKIYDDIPIEERQRDSSLGVPYRLWRHLQLAGHECYFDEFKIVINGESLNCHERLWKRMTEEGNKIDPSIYYIPM